jgi:hypothetical protein
MARAARRVFINCPFDSPYKPLFEAVVFCVLDCGFLPCSALEETDSGDIRLLKIIRLIRGCRLSIHDISRTEPDDAHKLPRFNMPFELGLFLGCRYSAEPIQKRKQCLILDRERHRYQKYLSDIGGQDVRSHGDTPSQAIECVRDWLRTTSKRSDIPGADEIFRRFQAFQQDLPGLCSSARLQMDKLIFADYCALVSQWLRQSPIDLSQHLASSDLRSVQAGRSNAPHDIGSLKEIEERR